jgi:hypothetical protein
MAGMARLSTSGRRSMVGCVVVGLLIAGTATASKAVRATAAPIKQTDTVSKLGIAPVKLNCQVSSCKGRLVLKTNGSNSKVTVGTQAFSISGPKNTPVNVTLSASAFRTVETKGALIVVATATTYVGTQKFHVSKRITLVK